MIVAHIASHPLFGKSHISQPSTCSNPVYEAWHRTSSAAAPSSASSGTAPPGTPSSKSAPASAVHREISTPSDRASSPLGGCFVDQCCRQSSQFLGGISLHHIHANQFGDQKLPLEEFDQDLSFFGQAVIAQIAHAL